MAKPSSHLSIFDTHDSLSDFSGFFAGTDFSSSFSSLSDSSSVERLATATYAKPAMGDIVTYTESVFHMKGGSQSDGPGSIFDAGTLDNRALALPGGIMIDGTVTPDEVTVYELALTAGETYVFSVYGAPGTTLSDTYLYVFDDTLSFDAILAEDDDGGAGAYSLITYTAGYTGTHYVGVGAYPGSGQGGDYVFDALLAPEADFVGDTFETAGALNLGGTTNGYIDGGPSSEAYPGFSEVDTYGFTVEAGKTYTFEVTGGADYNSDWTALADGELDTRIAIFDSEGNLVVANDDIGFPDDVSSRVSFTASEAGTFYLDVYAYTNFETDAFQTGGFTITSTITDLSTLDPLESLYWDSANNVTFDGDNIAYVYFGEAGETFGQTGDDGNPMVTQGWNEFEKQQVMSALQEYEKILGVTYEITTDESQATFRLATTSSEQYGAYFFPQDPAFGADQGVGVFNVDSGGWNVDQQQSLLKGGYAYAVILHEFGHAHGIAHPHDTGGGSEVLLGVTASQGSYGVFNLNQGVYTVMSYNDGYDTGPNGPSPYTLDGIDNGWSGTLSAFDIAVLQNRYGVTTPAATGDDVYVLSDANDVGTYYETIYDTGGVDSIEYSGLKDVQIDLLAATLDYSATGGGVVSIVDGVFGGYTIANGVVIENAVGGKGNDVILGNEFANILDGDGGDDTLIGRAGNDTLIGRAGNDVLIGGEGADSLDGGNDFLNGDAGDDLLIGGLGDDILFGGDGDDKMVGDAGADTFAGKAGFDIVSYTTATSGVIVDLNNLANNTGDAAGDTYASVEQFIGSDFNDELRGDTGADRMYGGAGKDTILGRDGNDFLYGEGGKDTIKGQFGNDKVFGGDGDDTLFGNEGIDTLKGGAGSDILVGGEEKDVLVGGADADIFRYADAADSGLTGATMDVITDFEVGVDDIDLAALGITDYLGDAAFTSTGAGEVRYEYVGGKTMLEIDIDGDGLVDMMVKMQGGNLALTVDDFLLA